MPSHAVLLVDDEAAVLSVLGDLVTHLGYAPVTAASGVAALEILKTAVPDAVLLDIAMPGALDGVQTLYAIKAAHPDLPVIMVTANADREVAVATLAAGAFDYVMKPVDLQRLRGVLGAAIVMSGKVPPEP
jgi:two-component system, NtrC family, response regulator AtoC